MLQQLAALCRIAIDPDAPRPSELPPVGPLLELAEQHDVSGLAVAVLLDHWADQLPDDLREGLQLYREGLGLDAKRAGEQLAEILRLLAARGLPAMPFKGPLLAQSAYRDPSLRSFLDLDFLVHGNDVEHVLACLREAGFVHQRGLGREGVEWVRRYGGDYTLYRPGGLPVEPHWHPMLHNMAFDIDLDAIWERAQPARFLDADCYFPAPQDHLFLLALHGAKTMWHKLKWVADIAAFLTVAPDPELAVLRGDASAQGCRRALDLALLLSHRLFQIPMTAPPADSVTERLAAAVIERLGQTAEKPHGPVYVAVTPFFWDLHEWRLDRWRYAARTIFRPELGHWRRLPLPPAWRWLYGPLKFPWDYCVTPAVRFTRFIARTLG